MSRELNLLMLGLPDSGKTTFLAALYELVNEKNEVMGSLRERDELPQRDYFWEIRQRWLAFEPLLHSQRSTDEVVRLLLEDGDGAQLDLEVPDIAGESFDEAWAGEDWPEVVHEHALAANAILLFVRADTVGEPPELPPGKTLREWLPTAEPTQKLSPTPGGLNVEAEDRQDIWKPEHAPTQTKLADLLEGMDRLRQELLPVAVVVSAWDTVAEEQTPEQWLEYMTPLFFQMLDGRPERAVKVFGVSAQGGDLRDENRKRELAGVKPPIHRVKVRDGTVDSHDISAPITWLMKHLA